MHLEFLILEADGHKKCRLLWCLKKKKDIVLKKNKQCKTSDILIVKYDF